jgi:Helix-turn-helix.
METGVMVKEYLKENGITQIFLSRKTGIKPAKLNLALNGARRFSLDEYALVCGALKVNIDYFLTPKIPEDKIIPGEEH